jgi:hypothetical protein
MAKGHYWDGPEEAHRSYCDAVQELSDKFLSERTIAPETMTPDQGRDLLKQIRESDDPRIRDFNRAMRMLRRSFEAVAPANEAVSERDGHDEQAHGRIWQSLHDRATDALNAFGKKDYRGRADYWIVDDDWGLDFIRVEVQNLQLMRPVVIESLKRILVDFPGWHIAVRVDVAGKEKSWPLMGLLVLQDRVIDHLKREYLPEEFGSLRYDGRTGDLMR